MGTGTETQWSPARDGLMFWPVTAADVQTLPRTASLGQEGACRKQVASSVVSTESDLLGMHRCHEAAG